MSEPHLDATTAVLPYKQLMADLYQKFGSPACDRIARAACLAAHIEAQAIKRGQLPVPVKHNPCQCGECLRAASRLVELLQSDNL